MALQDWRAEAEREAKRYSDTIRQNSQYLIDQLNQSKQNTLNQLQEQQNNSIYNLNSNKAEINQTAVDNAKQLNVARLLALKNNQSAMNRAGLGTQGVVGSQVNSINNDYGTNLTNVLNQKTGDLRNLEKEKNNTLLTYNTNRINLENEYGNNLANLQAQINEKALNQYNTVYNNYLAYKQQEYENQQAELARQEAIRQYNENMAFQKAQFEQQKQQEAITNAQKWASINHNSTNTPKNNNPEPSFDGLSDGASNLYTSLKLMLSAANTGSKLLPKFGAISVKNIGLQKVKDEITRAYQAGSINENDVRMLVSKLKLE